MPLPKQNSHKRKQQRRPCCLFICCSASMVADSSKPETDNDGGAAAVTTARKSWFSSYCLKKSEEKTTSSSRAKEEKHCVRHSPDQQKTPTEKVQVSTEVERPRPTQPMPNDGVSSCFSTEPIVKRRRRSHTGSPEPDRPADIETSVKGNLAETGRVKGFDRKAGLVIIGSALMVMVLYGQAAAVVCFCACLYFTTVLWRTEGGTTKTISGGVDVESMEYKKRVVLKGLLERDRRRPKV